MGKKSGRTETPPPPPSTLQILADHKNYTDPRRTWRKHYSALVVNISVDESSAAVSAAGWLSRGSGFNVLNKARLDFDTATDADIDRAVASDRRALAREKEIVIVFSAHATLGWGFGNDLSDRVRRNAPLMFDSELVGAMRFASFVQRASKLLDVKVAGVVLNGCNTGTELVVRDRFVPSSSRLLSCVLPNIPVVGIVGTCADVKVTGVFLPQEASGRLKEKIISRLDAAVLCRGGVVVDGRPDLHVTHKYTTSGTAKYLRLGPVGEEDVYSASGHDAMIRDLVAGPAVCHGSKILRRAMSLGALKPEQLTEHLERIEAGEETLYPDARPVEVVDVLGGEGSGEGGASYEEEPCAAVAFDVISQARIEAAREIAEEVVRAAIEGAMRAIEEAATSPVPGGALRYTAEGEVDCPAVDSAVPRSPKPTG